MAVGSEEAATKFLTMMGLTEGAINIQSKNIFTDEEADMIAAGMNYISVTEMKMLMTPTSLQLNGTSITNAFQQALGKQWNS